MYQSDAKEEEKVCSQIYSIIHNTQIHNIWESSQESFKKHSAFEECKLW